MEDAEAIVICIDNSKEAVLCSDSYKLQLEAIKLYCTSKLLANPKSEVSIYLMGGPKPRYLFFTPTSDLQEILDRVPATHVNTRGLMFVDGALYAKCALRCFSPNPSNKQKRMLFFAGSLTDMTDEEAELCGKNLKDLGIAVDVVSMNLKEDPKRIGENRYGRKQLDAFVAAVNHDNNSQIVHLNPGDSVHDVLSKTILEKTLHHLTMENHHQKKKGKHVPNLYRFEKLSLEGNRKMLPR